MGKNKNIRKKKIQKGKNTNIQGVLPEKFLERLEAFIPDKLTQLQVEKTFTRRPTTFRVNTLKTSLEKAKTELKEAGIKFSQPAWSYLAFVLENKSKKELMELPLYLNGEIYIQSFASQLPPVVLAPTATDKVLDLTAAPGSKTSQMAAMMGNKGELLANDSNKVRFFKLKHNIEHLGVENTTLRLEHGSKLAGFPELHEYFDKILLDAPCSAEARFVVGDIKTFGYWSEKKIKAMADTQRKLIFSAFRALKVGGTLVYSTCTLAPEENELLIDKFLSKHPNAKLLPIEIQGITKLEIAPQFKTKTISKEILQNTFRIQPDSQTEGFFIAKITKTAP